MKFLFRIFVVLIALLLQWTDATFDYLSCGQKSYLKRTILQNPKQLPSACQYTIQRNNPRVCQLLIHFEEFDSPQPSLQDLRMNCGDRIQVGKFVICGSNSQQHLYLPFDSQSITIKFELPQRSASTKWHLIVKQLECPSPVGGPLNTWLNAWENMLATRTIFPNTIGAQNDYTLLAPPGCDQYFMEPSGTIKSFNFNAKAGSLYMRDMNYVICVKPQGASTKILYDVQHFSLSVEGLLNLGYDEDCRSTILTTGRRSDYLLIPQASIINQQSLRPTFFCGHSLNLEQVEAQMPFMLYFSSDAITDPVETGFHIEYSVK